MCVSTVKQYCNGWHTDTHATLCMGMACLVSTLRELKSALSTTPPPELALLVDIFAADERFVSDAREAAADMGVPMLTFCNGAGMQIDADMRDLSVSDIVAVSLSFHEIAIRNSKSDTTLIIAARFPDTLENDTRSKVLEELKLLAGRTCSSKDRLVEGLG